MRYRAPPVNCERSKTNRCCLILLGNGEGNLPRAEGHHETRSRIDNQTDETSRPRKLGATCFLRLGVYTMIAYPTEQKLIRLITWLFIASIVLAMVNACSPYVSNYQADNLTPAPSVTAIHLGKISPSDTPTPRPSCTVTGETVYLRAGAGMNYSPVTVLHYGQVLELLERSNNWLSVATLSHEGFIHARYCQEDNDQ
jgi:hypothetical protein